MFRSMILDSQPRVMALELHDLFKIFWTYFLISFSKSPPPPLFNCRGTDFFLILYLLAILKFGKKEKFGECIKVPILFVRGCNFSRCRLNNNISFLRTNSECYRKIIWNELNKTISLLTIFLNYFLAFLVPSMKFPWKIFL